MDTPEFGVFERGSIIVFPGFPSQGGTILRKHWGPNGLGANFHLISQAVFAAGVWPNLAEELGSCQFALGLVNAGSQARELTEKLLCGG